MPPALVLSADQQALVAAYARTVAGLGTGPERLWGAKAFCARVGQPDDWIRLTVAEQCALPQRVRTFVAWLLVTGRLRASADYLAAAPHLIGRVAAHQHPALHATFTQTACTLGFTPESARRQWAAVVRVAALHQVTPDQPTGELQWIGQVAAARPSMPGCTVRRTGSPRRPPARLSWPCGPVTPGLPGSWPPGCGGPVRCRRSRRRPPNRTGCCWPATGRRPPAPGRRLAVPMSRRRRSPTATPRRACRRCGCWTAWAPPRRPSACAASSERGAAWASHAGRSGRPPPTRPG